MFADTELKKNVRQMNKVNDSQVTKSQITLS